MGCRVRVPGWGVWGRAPSSHPAVLKRIPHVNKIVPCKGPCALIAYTWALKLIHGNPFKAPSIYYKVHEPFGVIHGCGVRHVARQADLKHGDIVEGEKLLFGQTGSADNHEDMLEDVLEP